MLDENNERIRMPTKNKRLRPWLLEIKFNHGIGAKWGWTKWGTYRTEEEALKAVNHHQRSWAKDMEIRVSRLDRSQKA